MLKHHLPKKIWQNLNSVLGNSKHSKKQSEIEKLIYNNISYDDNCDITNILNEYFVNVGTTLANNLPISSMDFKSFLGPSAQNSIFVDNITAAEVCKVIESMRGGTAAGDDGFNLELIKNNTEILAQPLSYIYNLSMYTGIV